MGDCEDRGGGGGARRGAKRQVGVVVLVRDVKPHVYLEYVFTVALNRCLAGTGGVRSVAFGPTYAYVYIFVWDKCVSGNQVLTILVVEAVGSGERCWCWGCGGLYVASNWFGS